MSKRPDRPAEDFLYRIGIFHLPDNVDIGDTGPQGHIDRTTLQWVSLTAFVVTEVDRNNKIVKATSVAAFENATRTKHDIWRDLRNTLVGQFNAIPIQSGLHTDLSIKRAKPPTEQFLQRVGVAALPEDIDITFRNGDVCEMAFIIKKFGHNGHPVSEAEIPARTTRAHGPNLVWERVGDTLIKFGATPREKAPELTPL